MYVALMHTVINKVNSISSNSREGGLLKSSKAAIFSNSTFFNHSVAVGNSIAPSPNIKDIFILLQYSLVKRQKGGPGLPAMKITKTQSSDIQINMENIQLMTIE
jgi:hypothetical protein